MPKSVPKQSVLGKVDASDGVQPPPDRTINAILDRVIEHIDLTGLEQKLVEQLSVKLGSNIRIEQLADAILGRRTEELSDRLMEKIIDRMTGN